MEVNAAFVIGITAAFCSTVSFVPQVIKAHRSRHTKDLSMAMLVLLTIGISLWIAYGVMIGELPVILANSITLLFLIYLLSLKLRHG